MCFPFESLTFTCLFHTAKNLFPTFYFKKISSQSHGKFSSKVKRYHFMEDTHTTPTPLSSVSLLKGRRGKEEIEFCEYVDLTSSCNKFWLIFDNLFHAFGDDERRELNAFKEIYIIFHAMDFIAFSTNFSLLIRVHGEGWERNEIWKVMMELTLISLYRVKIGEDNSNIVRPFQHSCFCHYY